LVFLPSFYFTLHTYQFLFEKALEQMPHWSDKNPFQATLFLWEPLFLLWDGTLGWSSHYKSFVACSLPLSPCVQGHFLAGHIMQNQAHSHGQLYTLNHMSHQGKIEECEDLKKPFSSLVSEYQQS
jgi:hypothetical protein